MTAWAWFKKWFLDGWITDGPQIACPPGEVRAFAECYHCRHVYPHWYASMTAAEAKARGFIGCAHCRGLRIQPVMIEPWRAFYWFAIRGWLIRKVLLKARLWDPRMPVLWQDLT